MSDTIKSPLTCSSAKFGLEEIDQDVMKFLSCSAWRNLDDVNVERLGLGGRRSLEVRMYGGAQEDAISKLGARCSAICEGCDRFEPREQQPIAIVSRQIPRSIPTG